MKKTCDEIHERLDASDEDSRWPVFIVALVTLLIFLPLCTHEFTWWDDWATVHQNKWLNPPTLASFRHYWTSIAYGLYVPVTYTAWILLAKFAHLDHADPNNIALNPWVFHSANVGVHVLSAIAVFILLRQLVKKDWPACCGALLFALHPVQVEPVGWVSGLKDVLAGFFAIVALLRFVGQIQKQCDHGDTEAQRTHGEETKKNFSLSSPYLRVSVVAFPDWLGTIALILAMLSKPSAVVVPLIALGTGWLILRRSLRESIARTIVWFILTIPILIVARIAQDVTGIPKAPLWSRPLILTDTLAFYIAKIAWPIKLGADYGRTPAKVIDNGFLFWTWIAPVAVAAVVLALRKRFRWLAGAGWIFLAAILPVSGLVTFQFQFTSTVADHYLYLAMLGPAVAMAFLLRERGNVLTFVVSALLLSLLAVRTILLAPAWSDDFTLFSHALEVNQDSAVAENNLGNTLKQRGKPDEALPHFQRAMQLSPNYPNAFNSAAFIYAERGDWRTAVDMWEKSVEIRARLPRTLFPNFAEDHNRIGQVLLEHGEYQRAVNHFEALLKVEPNHPEAKKFLAIAKEKLAPPTTTSPAHSIGER